MKTIVISLKHSVERRSLSSDILQQNNIEFDFLDAVDGRVGKHPLLTRYCKKEFVLNYGRYALPGEIGCYASHFLAWQYCVDIGEPLLVLEDDFLLTSGFVEAIDTSNNLIGKYGFIRLETTKKKPQIEIIKQNHFTLIKFLKVPQCATCYMISPKVAQAFIDASTSFKLPVDTFIRHISKHKQNIYGLEPYQCQAGRIFNSEIGKRSRGQHKSIYLRICIIFRKISNTSCNFMELVRQLIHIYLLRK